MGRPRKAATAGFNSTAAAIHSHFFRVILDNTIKEKKLKLPTMFVMKYGKKLSNVATFTVPQGGVWRIGLEKEGSDVWFRDNWHRFLQYYSITSGDFLVFRYENNSKFHVLMFDHSTCEIRYRSGNGVRQLSKNHIMQDGIESKDDVQIIIGSSETPKSIPLEDRSCKRPSTSLEASKSEKGRNLKRSKTCKIHEKSQVILYTEGHPNEDPNNNKNNKIATLSTLAQAESQVILHKKRHLYEDPNNDKNNSKIATLAQAESQVILRIERHPNVDSNNKNNNKSVATPACTDEAAGTRKKHSVEAAGTRKKHSDEAAVNRKKHSDEAAGTRKKHSDEAAVNRKKHTDEAADDTDLFALLDEMGISISKCGKVAAKDRERAIKAARWFKPKNPSFMIILRQSYLNKVRVYAPSKFAKKYVKRDVEWMKLQDSGGRVWPVRIRWRDMGGFTVQNGISEFFRHMNFEEGDVCIFELVKDNVFKVSILHACVS